jgi:MSHA biogenesis protein MshN
MNAARLQVDANDHAGAWQTLQRGLPAALNQADYRAFCGTVLSRLKRHGEAADHYRAAVTASPGEGRWWFGLAMALEDDGKPAESRTAFARAQASGTLPAELSAYVDSKLKPR